MNVEKLFIFLLSTFILGVFTTENVSGFVGNARLTVKVVGEDGEPIDSANVGIGFESNTGFGTKITGSDGLSNDEGRFNASGVCNGHISYGADKEGYYDSYHSYDFLERGAFRWKPWNPEFTVVLRKIENPVPMYARNTRESKIEIPAVGEKVGFDLIAFDWVVPYGKGSVPDFVFLLKKERGGPKDFTYELNLSFSGKFNGIKGFTENFRQGSVFKLPRLAPLEGYHEGINAYIKRTKERAGGFSWKDDQHYIFRIRSEEEDGRLKRAMYGKILGDIEIGTKHPGTAYIKFKYYLNPDYTRNLEYDPERNLFGPLPLLEQVGIQ